MTNGGHRIDGYLARAARAVRQPDWIECPTCASPIQRPAGECPHCGTHPGGDARRPWRPPSVSPSRSHSGGCARAI